jgi:hypothetical protein
MFVIMQPKGGKLAYGEFVGEKMVEVVAVDQAE